MRVTLGDSERMYFWMFKIFKYFGRYLWFVKSIEQCAATTIRCVSLKDDQIISGAYYQLSNCVNIKQLEYRLWKWSEQLVLNKGFKLTKEIEKL